MERKQREEDGVIYLTVTLTQDDVRQLATTPCEIIEAPGEGKMIVVDRLPGEPRFYSDGVEVGPIIYHVEEML